MNFYRLARGSSFEGRASKLIFVFIFIFAIAPTASAALYSPGQTLDPACAPTDVDCGISSIVATSTDIAALGYSIAAWGDSLTAGAYSQTPYPTQLSTLSGYTIYNGGIGGDISTGIATRMLAATDKSGWPTIIWAGRNDITGDSSSDEPTILSSIASMVASLTTSRYLVLGILNESNETVGTTNYAEVTTINNDLAVTYGSHYLDIRAYLVQNGLTAAGITPTSQDLTDISNDVVPSSLREDAVHLTTAGYGDVATEIYANKNILLGTSSDFSDSIITPAGLRLAFGDFSTGYSINGARVLYATSTNFSTLVGLSAGSALLSSATWNTAVGFEALQIATSSDGNTAVGFRTLSLDTSGGANTALGYDALASNTTGSNNTALGYAALTTSTTTSSNTAIGYFSLRLNTTGTQNAALGYQSLTANTTGSSNTGLGYSALSVNTTGSNNSVLGRNALSSNTSGSNNTAMGYFALSNNLSATSSTALGYQAADGSGGAYNNQGGVYVGYRSGHGAFTSSDYNTFLGYQSGLDVTTGNTNIILGPEVNTGGNHLTTGQGDIGIGYNIIFPGGTSASNQLNIGNFIFGTGLTATSSSTSLPASFTGNLGIGTSTPNAEFEVSTSTTNTTLTAGGPMVAITNRSTTANNFEELSFRTQDLTNGFATSSSKIVGINTLHTANAVSGALAFFTNNAGTMGEDGRFTAAGNLGVGTTSPATKLEVGGDITDDNVLNCATLKTDVNGKLNCVSSDQRLKQGIAPLDASSSLAAIEQLNPVSFYWKNPTDGTQEQLGFIAQDVRQIFPELVATGSPTVLTPDGTLTFNYLGLISPMVKAIQELAAEVDGFAQSFVSKNITAQDKLCVGSTCIDESQLRVLLQNSGQQFISPSAPSGESADSNATTATSTDGNPNQISLSPDTDPVFGALSTGTSTPTSTDSAGSTLTPPATTVPPPPSGTGDTTTPPTDSSPADTSANQ